MRNKIAVAIIIITTLIPTVETCLAKQLPFSKPIDFISGKTYGGNKKVWDVEFDDEGRLFVAASEKLCIWDGMDWTGIDFGNCLRDLYFDKETSRCMPLVTTSSAIGTQMITGNCSLSGCTATLTTEII